MFAEQLQGIRGGTKFYELDEESSQPNLNLAPVEFENQDQCGQISKLKYIHEFISGRNVKVIQPKQPMFCQTRNQNIIQNNVFLSPQRQKPLNNNINNNSNNTLRSIKALKIQPSNQKTDQQGMSTGFKVEDRLLLYDRRRKEQLEKQRKTQHREMMKPVPSIGNKENKQVGVEDVYVRLFQSSKKNTQHQSNQKKRNEESPYIQAQIRINDSQVPLEQVIKSVPDYLLYPNQLNINQPSSFPQYSSVQSQETVNVTKIPPQVMETLIKQNYFRVGLGEKSQSAISVQTRAINKSQINRLQQKQQANSIIEQCMEAYSKKNIEKQKQFAI